MPFRKRFPLGSDGNRVVNQLPCGVVRVREFETVPLGVRLEPPRLPSDPDCLISKQRVLAAWRNSRKSLRRRQKRQNAAGDFRRGLALTGKPRKFAAGFMAPQTQPSSKCFSVSAGAEFESTTSEMLPIQVCQVGAVLLRVQRHVHTQDQPLVDVPVAVDVLPPRLPEMRRIVTVPLPLLDDPPAVVNIYEVRSCFKVFFHATVEAVVVVVDNWIAAGDVVHLDETVAVRQAHGHERSRGAVVVSVGLALGLGGARVGKREKAMATS